jgi:hypothetical protein
MPTASFKTPCPSCEAAVLVKDESMIGKKIDCPKCKYRFVIEAPKGKEKTAPAKQPAAAPAAAKAKGAPPAKTATKIKPGAKPPAAPAGEEKEGEKKKRKAGLSNKMMLRLGLAGAGVVVLAVAAFLILGKKSPTKSPIKPGPRLDLAKNVDSGNTKDDAKGPRKGAKTNAKGTTEPKGKPENDGSAEAVKAAAPAVPVAAAGPELTNLLPAEAQQVTHFFMKDAVEGIPMLMESAFQPGALKEDDFKQRLGFSPKAVDDVIRAENYATPWAFTVVHLREAVDEDALKKGLGLVPAAGSPMSGRDFFKVTKNLPWLEQFGRLSLGTLPPTPPAKGEDRPLFVRIHDPGTLVFGDAAPMQEYLARGSLPSGNYATLKNAALAALLKKVEKASDPDRVLVSSATDLAAALLPAAPGRVVWRYRPLWDIAHSLPDNPQRLRLIGAALLRKGRGEPISYRYQNEIECTSAADAHSLKDDVADKVAPGVARFLDMLLGLKVVVAPAGITEKSLPSAPGFPPSGGRPPPGAPGYTPFDPKKDPVKVEPTTSYITMANTDKSVSVTLHAALEDKALAKLSGVTDLLMVGISGQLEAAAGKSHRADLARAVKLLGEQGVKDRGTAGQYPRGLFPAKAKTRAAGDPALRISWMAGLLPYLGHEALYSRITFGASWKDPTNWMTARAVVPEFLDPSYPLNSALAHYPAVPFPLGGTHFVGIAGVGQDAPDYAADDPAVANKLGVFGYERQTSLEEIKKNRGLSHTAVMVQVPYNGSAGVTPWMAGGGSTLRGVPETGSVRPFVSTTENGKAGTYILMADGSVRFVAADVSDQVFKTMCTIKGPAQVAGAK